MCRCAEDVTACIPTFDRAGEVTRTIETLLAGSLVPATILVSEAAGEAARQALGARLGCLDAPETVTIRLVPAPPCGNRSGNRNWLAAHAETALILFMDDDVAVHPDFLADAAPRVRAGTVSIVVASTKAPDGSGWLTFRGHFRSKAPRDPIAVGFAVSLWGVNLFRHAWLDEALIYGYEDADISLRLLKAGLLRVHQSDYRFLHNGIGRGTPDDALARVRAADEARCYVSARRYAGSRLRLGTFLAVEVLCNARRRRRLLPSGQVPGQWWGVVRFLTGSRGPSWMRSSAPPLHLSSGLGGPLAGRSQTEPSQAARPGAAQERRLGA